MKHSAEKVSQKAYRKNARYLARKMRLESIPVAREQGGAGIEHVPQPTCTRIQSLANREGESGIDTMPTIAKLEDQSRYVLKIVICQAW